MLQRKHIKAPRSYDPGPKHPREHLAYMTKAEQELLRVLTDGEISRGPKGIPSFTITTGTRTGSSVSTGSGSSNYGGSSGGPGGGSLQAPVRTNPSSASSSSVNNEGASRGSNQTSSSSSSSRPSSSPPSTSMGSNSQNTSSTARTTTASRVPGTSAAAAAASSAASRNSSQTTSRPSVTSMGSSSQNTSNVAGSGRSTYSTPMTRTPERSTSSSDRDNDSRSASATSQTRLGPVASPPSMTQSQSDAYRQFGERMLETPRAPEVQRTPGDAERLARMAMAESGIIRDETRHMNPAGAQAVMSVIRNRMEDQDATVDNIISQRAQFSPWGDGKYSVTAPDPAYTALAEQVLRGNVADITDNADSYHNPTTVNGVQSTASATTRNRINNNFTPTLTINDAIKPGTYGHQFGYATDGSRATPRSTQRQAVDPGGARDMNPAALPQGALSQNPSYGGMGLGASEPAFQRAPGRFGGMVPAPAGEATRIAYNPGDEADAAARVSLGINYQPDAWERDVGFLASRTAPPNSQEASDPGYANPYSAVDPRLITGASAMIRDAEDATGSQARINDAYRSYWHQALGSPPRPGQKARPGNSWHQAGTAIDIGSGPVLNYLQSRRGSLNEQYGLTQPMPVSDPYHFQVPGMQRPFPGQTSGLRPPGDVDVENQAVAQYDGEAPGMPSVPSAPGLMTRGLSALGGVLRGEYKFPGDQIREAMADPRVQAYFKAQASGPLAAAAARGLASAYVGPVVDNAITSGMQAMNNFFTPSAPSTEQPVQREDIGYGLSQPGRAPTTQTASATSPTRGADPRLSDPGSGRNPQIQEQPYYRPPPPPAPPVAPPAPPPVDWSYYMNVLSQEEAMRRLLGEEWYA